MDAPGCVFPYGKFLDKWAWWMPSPLAENRLVGSLCPTSAWVLSPDWLTWDCFGLPQLSCLRWFTADSTAPLSPGNRRLIDEELPQLDIAVLYQVLNLFSSKPGSLALEWYSLPVGSWNASTSICNHLMVADDGLGLLEWLMSSVL
ncbi:hypothetical protein Nepgr_006558 [Nepenthes gracilis]|uniref:Uncharacterized protein n=1 Tax=Nepenthes gracilis TaxID=150966 RepID=A0AAD3S5E0_NEPGR|nr:hypothetical protein Nepgr_006558 [Nepenthes gracilis]